jgi:leader peptidase (prepilin peptidase)/N-methyltransferase
MSCGYQLAWYDMVPVFSWLFLRGKCRRCRQSISPQYPIIEAVNGLVYVLVFAVNDFTLQSVIYCLMMSALLVLAIIDWRTYEIPVSINIFILCLGILQTVLDLSNWTDHIVGLLCVSMFLYLLLVISRGRAIGGGDVKLMAAAGLILGWKNIILAFLIGCILGSIIHLLRMKISGADHVLAMGPYLAIGIAVAALWGDTLVSWYLSFLL